MNGLDGNAALEALEQQEGSGFEMGNLPLVSENAEMKRIMQMAENAATSKATVLITGASGTGKEVLARFIHAKSHRAIKEFVAVNCAALPDGLLESELFGYEKGAFTGAFQSKIGKFELAHGSSLLLDEISEMDGRLQAKLLRALQESVVDRIGGKQPVKVNVRIIATSNRDLKRCIDAGTFRKDLYYRLNVVHIHIPSLKNRPEDILPLMNFYLAEFSKSHSRAGVTFSQEAYDRAMKYSWPGNVRELQNVVSRAVLLSEGSTITEEHLGLEEEQPVPTVGMAPEWQRMSLGDIERWVILERLKEFSGNRTHSSRALGISIRTLRNKIREYKALGIDVP